MGLRPGGEASGKLCNLYLYLCLETVFPTLNRHKIVTYIIIYKHFCFCSSSLTPHVVGTERLSSTFEKYMKAKGLQKSQFSNNLVNWEKFGSVA